MQSKSWSVQDEILRLQTQWLTLVGEHFQVPDGPDLEYWRIEKADSVIVLPLQGKQILIPPHFYRPGLGQMTVDLPGGRCPAEQPPDQTAMAILERELSVPERAIAQLTSLTSAGWPINSSFSNQKLYGFVAQIYPDFALLPNKIGTCYGADAAGIASLLHTIRCAQCRLVIREWQAVRQEMENS